MLVHDSNPFSVILKHADIELLVQDLKLKNQNIVCALMYRPPSSNRSVMLDLESTLDQLPQAKSRNMILLGDFNIDSSCLNSIRDKLGLLQVVSSPTRTTSTTTSIIEHIYVSDNISNSHSAPTTTVFC